MNDRRLPRYILPTVASLASGVPEIYKIIRDSHWLQTSLSPGGPVTSSSIHLLQV